MFRTTLVAIASSTLLASAASAGTLTAQDIDDLLARMTVAEKAGQMTQLSVSTLIDGEETPGSPYTINEDKLRDIVVTHGVGSLFGVWHGPLSVERWRDLVSRIQTLATEETRLGIPVVFADDSVHGANYLIDGTIFPHNLNLAATWNPGLAEASGRITASETRAKGTHWTFAPVADVMRQPQWSRVFETFGEDPLLASAMASASVRGLQGDDLTGDDTVAATAKHFLGYSVPLSGRDRTPAYITPTQMRDIHLPSFRAVFDAGVETVMINSGEINGVPVHADPTILIDLLRGELGFEGVAVTDWADIDKLVGVHRVAKDKKDAARIALESGVDMSMVAQSTDFTTNVIELVKEGSLSESTLDRSVRRILKLKDDLGLFQNPVGGDASVASVGSKAHHRVSLDAARESLVLLRNNESLLPLAEGARILVTGPTADDLVPMHGAWTYTWQGHERGWYPDRPTVADAVATRFGSDNVTYIAGSGLDGPAPEGSGIAAAVEAAGNADVTVLCLGELPGTERPGDLSDLNIDASQLDLAEALIATGKPVVMVMVTNRPRTFGSVEAGLDAVVWAGHPGPHGGTAVAELLAGDINPSGRLPFTYPRHPASISPYDRKHSENIQSNFAPGGHDSLFEFGEGMGYAPFEYGQLQVELDGRDVTVSVGVTNTGTRAGKEVVQLYVSDLVASVTPYARRLRGFEKITLQAGETKRVSFTVPSVDLAVTGRDGESRFEPGDFRFAIGGLSHEIEIR